MGPGMAFSLFLTVLSNPLSLSHLSLTPHLSPAPSASLKEGLPDLPSYLAISVITSSLTSSWLPLPPDPIFPGRLRSTSSACKGRAVTSASEDQLWHLLIYPSQISR